MASLTQLEDRAEIECHINKLGPVLSTLEGNGDYSAFISDGLVSLSGQKNVSVKI